MYKTTVAIDGMHCGMCEANVNNLIRRNCRVKKVSSSHKAGRSVIISESEIDIGLLTRALASMGYRVLSCDSQPCEKKGLFHH